MDDHSVRGVADATGIVSAAGVEFLSGEDDVRVVAPDFDRDAENAKWAAASESKLVAALDAYRDAKDWPRYDVVGRLLGKRVISRLTAFRWSHEIFDRMCGAILPAIFDPESRHHARFVDDFDKAFARRQDVVRVAFNKHRRRYLYEEELEGDVRAKIGSRVADSESPLRALKDWRNSGRVTDLLDLQRRIDAMPQIEAEVVLLFISGHDFTDIARQTGEDVVLVRQIIAAFGERLLGE